MSSGQRRQRITQPKLAAVRSIALVVILSLGPFAHTAAAEEEAPAPLLGIDGDIEPDESTTDWTAIFDQDGARKADAPLDVATFVADHGDAAHLVHVGGDKDRHGVQGWGCKDEGDKPPKADLLNVYAAIPQDTPDALYLGVERKAPKGSTAISVWLLQEAASCVPTSEGGTGQFVGESNDGDLLITIDLRPAEPWATGTIYAWQSDSASTLVPIGASGPCSDPANGFYDGACVEVNDAPVVTPWAPANEPATALVVDTFIELGLDLDGVWGFDSAPCYSNLIVQTRASHQIQSALKDLVIFDIDTCAFSTDPDDDGGDNNTTTPPDNNTTSPPDNNTTTPPDNNTTTPPDNNTTTPPDNNTTTPPDNNTTTPPDNNTTTPPDNNTTSPPDNNTTTPPDNNTTTPPDNNTTTPPDNNTTTPPDNNTTTPPDNNTTSPPDNNTTPPPDNDTITPTELHLFEELRSGASDTPNGTAEGFGRSITDRYRTTGLSPGLTEARSKQRETGQDRDEVRLLRHVEPVGTLGTIDVSVSHAIAESTIDGNRTLATQFSYDDVATVNILDGLVTASTVRAVATAAFDGSHNSFSSQGSYLTHVTVLGREIGPIATSQKIFLPADTFGENSYVALYEREIINGPFKGPLGEAGRGVLLDVKMIHVVLTDANPNAPGDQPADIAVGHARAQVWRPAESGGTGPWLTEITSKDGRIIEYRVRAQVTGPGTVEDFEIHFNQPASMAILDCDDPCKQGPGSGVHWEIASLNNSTELVFHLRVWLFHDTAPGTLIEHRSRALEGGFNIATSNPTLVFVID